jgi:hypothetical protein
MGTFIFIGIAFIYAYICHVAVNSVYTKQHWKRMDIFTILERSLIVCVIMSETERDTE